MPIVMKDSGIEWIGKIPEEWEYVRLKHFYEFEKGKNATVYTQEYIGRNVGDYPVYSGQTENNGIMGKINSYDYDINECLFTTTVGAKVMTPKILSGKFSLSQNCLIMHQIENCNNKYFYYILLSLFDYEKSLIPTYMQPSLRMEDLRRYSFYIPNINLQKKLADFLDEKVAEIDSAIEKTKVTIEDYKKYKQSIITEAVTIGINKETKYFNSDVIGLGKVREDAQILKFKYVGVVKANLVNVKDYLEYPQIAPDKIEKSSGKLLFYNKVKEAGVISDNHLFYKGMNIYSKIRPLLNKANIAEFDGLCSADMYPIESYINTKYLLYYILSNAFLGQISVSDNRVKMPKLNKEELYEIKVVVPSENEQEKIVEYLDKKCSEIDVLIAKKEELIKELESYKKSLIYECVTGKREV